MVSSAGGYRSLKFQGAVATPKGSSVNRAPSFVKSLGFCLGILKVSRAQFFTHMRMRRGFYPAAPDRLYSGYSTSPALGLCPPPPPPPTNTTNATG